MVSSGDAFQQHLLDERYWGPRLQRLRREPRRLVQKHRADLARPGVQVIEVSMRSHDGTQIHGFLARSAFHATATGVHLRTCVDLETCVIDWQCVEAGRSDLVFAFPEGRRLEERVLDVLRVVLVVSSLEGVDARDVLLYSGHQSPSDAFAIADLVRKAPWF